MRTGYKQTDIGLIPVDWNVVSLEEIGQCLNGLTYKPENVSKSGTLVLRSSNIQDGMLAYEDNVFVDMELPENVITEEGDILICVRNGSRPLIGKCALIDSDTAGAAFGAFMAVFRTEFSDYVFQQFQSSSIKKQISENLGATINQITNKSLKSFKVALPKNRAETLAIAEALGDVDRLIAGLERLIAKKRAVKTAVMQQLLTGKTRLAGFERPWETVTFGICCQPRTERVDPKKLEDSVRCIELEHIEQGTGKVLGNVQANSLVSIKTAFYPGDVLFGKLRSYLRKYWLADRQGVCSTEIWVLAADGSRILPEYVYQIVRTDSFIEAASEAYGTHMPRADWKVMKDFEIELPSLPEQQAITEILSDLDAEIAALEARRDKTKAIKQGMMQELLTGKTRLV